MPPTHASLCRRDWHIQASIALEQRVKLRRDAYLLLRYAAEQLLQSLHGIFNRTQLAVVHTQPCQQSFRLLQAVRAKCRSTIAQRLSPIQETGATQYLELQDGILRRQVPSKHCLLAAGKAVHARCI
jgi:hypothetical protein